MIYMLLFHCNDANVKINLSSNNLSHIIRCRLPLESAGMGGEGSQNRQPANPSAPPQATASVRTLGRWWHHGLSRATVRQHL